MTESVPPRRKPKTETARERLVRACAKHLEDLKRAHGRPPSDVPVRESSTVRLISPVSDGSYCTSPAQLCAELGEENLKRAHGRPQPEVLASTSSTAPLVSPVHEGSNCASPAQPHAELAEE